MTQAKKLNHISKDARNNCTKLSLANKLDYYYIIFKAYFAAKKGENELYFPYNPRLHGYIEYSLALEKRLIEESFIVETGFAFGQKYFHRISW